jgi:hypothetical protein
MKPEDRFRTLLRLGRFLTMAFEHGDAFRIAISSTAS